MIAANTRDLSLLTEQLVEHLMAAVLFANKIQEAMAAEHLMIGSADGSGAVAASIHPSVRIKERPILDSSTLTMMWKGKRGVETSNGAWPAPYLKPKRYIPFWLRLTSRISRRGKVR